MFLLVLAAIYFSYYQGPFRNYRPWLTYSLTIRPTELQHNQNVDILLREKLTIPLTEKERAILEGLHWLARFIDDDQVFDEIFSNIIILFYELRRGLGRPHQQEVAQLLLTQSLERGKSKLAQFFPADEDGRWDYIGILSIVDDFPDHKADYFEFYRRHFARKPPVAYKSGDLEFDEAVSQCTHP